MARNYATKLTKIAAVSLLFLSDGSQANKVVCGGTVDDLKLALVTLAAVEAAHSKHTFFPRTHLTPHRR